MFWPPPLWTPNQQHLQGAKDEAFVLRVISFSWPSLPPFLSLLPPSPSKCLPLPCCLWGSDVMLRGPGSLNLSWMSGRFHLESPPWKISHDCLENCAVKDVEVQTKLSGSASCDQLMMSVRSRYHAHVLIPASSQFPQTLYLLIVYLNSL